MTMTWNVGYVGLDHHHCEPYLATLAQLDTDVVAAAEPNPEFDPGSVSGLGDVPVYDDPYALLDEADVDVVFVTLSNRDTPAFVDAAVDAGVHVYTEKPAARTAADLAPVVDRAARSDVTVGVSYTWQGHPIARQLKELMADGFYGDVRAFETRFVASSLAHRDTSHFLFDAEASRGGILQWLGIHWVQLIAWLVESPVERVNAGMTYDTPEVDVEDGASLQLETADGALGTLHCGYYLDEGLYDTQFNVYGTDGRSVWDPMGRRFGFDGKTKVELDAFEGDGGSDASASQASDGWDSTPHRTIVHDYEPAPGYGGHWGREFIQRFFEACETGSPPPVGLEDALEVLRILDAAYASAETGEWETVER